MERLLKPAFDGGVPYINQDFYFILQQNNLQSYRSFLETINDFKGVGNSGIIIKGIKDITPVGQQTGSEFEFNDSMIYLDGDFLEPKPNINTTISSSKFYLVKYTEYENREKKVSGFSEPVLEKNFFDVSLAKPNNSSYIEIERKNQQNICTRYLNRILKYYNSRRGQILMTFKKDWFDNNTGVGYGQMFGFRITDGEGPTTTNKAPNLKNRFLIGFSYSTTSTTDPESALSVTDINYGKLGNCGGLDFVQIIGENLPAHDHGSCTGDADNNLRHKHELPMYPDPAGVIGDSNGTTDPGALFVKSKVLQGQETQPSSLRYKSFRTANRLNLEDDPLYGPLDDLNFETKKQNYRLPNYYGNTNNPTLIWDIGSTRNEKTDLQTHTHLLSTSESVPHNNLPPYINVIYYVKWDPYIE